MKKLDLSDFFLNMKHFRIPGKYVEQNLRHSLSSYPILKAVLKYKDRPSISIIKSFLYNFQILTSCKLIQMPFLKKSENLT